MKKKVKIYDRDFKVKAVLLSFQRNSIEPVERELGITKTLLNRWRQDYEKYGDGSFPGFGNLRISPGQKKIYLLEKRIAKAELHSLIIKNAAPYLCQGRPGIYIYIESCEKICSAKQICMILSVDQRCYSRWKNKYVSDTKKKSLP
ncbi:hypothetical protein [Flavobacterium sp. SORGH_AS_0622]|uniref:hypothetical protein n=1 Tax=Flavobacterium sp. SORGH_AS_0622 TaxID=3041772 RepID=UPI002787C697|nr:hypothetical protein [Flavobacterium sp. SORGH_AS_0622]MDQ1165618.1 transposase-like protein [Flavobacterium sp. SORGH_AS_0622]